MRVRETLQNALESHRCLSLSRSGMERGIRLVQAVCRFRATTGATVVRLLRGRDINAGRCAGASRGQSEAQLMGTAR